MNNIKHRILKTSEKNGIFSVTFKVTVTKKMSEEFTISYNLDDGDSVSNVGYEEKKCGLDESLSEFCDDETPYYKICQAADSALDAFLDESDV